MKREFCDRYTRVPNSVLLDSRLRASDKLVYWALLARDYTGKGSSWPSQETIAGDTGLCERTVWASVKRLAECGYLRVVRHERSRGGQWSGNVYELCHQVSQ